MMIKKVSLVIALTGVFSVSGAAQKAGSPTKTIKPPPVSAPAVTTISDAEWKVLTNDLQAEDWTKAAAAAARYLNKLKIDNDKKQLAQLRYLRLYTLAGKILAVQGAKVPADNDALWKELDDAVSEFNGEELVLPPHRYMNDCQKRVNYICRVADNDRALRVTATNDEGTAIHSFDYVIFDDANSLSNLPESELFLGGVLKRIEYNQDVSKPWIMRLIFEKGFVSSAAK